MKKILSILLVVAMVAVLAVGCASESKEVSYEDGTYNGEEAEFDSRGYKAVVDITIVDGRITEVSYDEIMEDGSRKSQDETYRQNWLDQREVDLLEAFAALEQELIDKQNPDDVDTYTGATSASDRFRAVAEKALEDAKK